MPTESADRNLLFGILALQNNFISREGLLAAFNVWVTDKSQQLGKVLLGQRKLTQPQLDLLSALVDELLKQHRGSAQECLEQLSSIRSARRDLEELRDPDLEASLWHVSLADSDDAETLLPTTIGAPSVVVARFRILRPHAEGGLGRLSVAHDEELGREVALKEIKPRFAADAESRKRFLREAEITGGLEHPSIVPVYGLGQYADGRPFYAMRFIRGKSLKDEITAFYAADREGVRNETERNVELRRLLQRLLDVCEAIEYAHSRGVLHRDLKPGNVMLGKYGETLVVDWGLARAGTKGDAHDAVARRSSDDEPSLHPRSGDSSATSMGETIGTPAYMPPEQAAGRLDLLGPASDVYSLGGTLYTILTGKSPVAGATTAEVLQNVKEGRIVAPRGRNRKIPKALEAICLKALSHEPADRYPSARLLADDLEHYLAGEPVAAYSEPFVARLRRYVRRHQTAATSTAVGLVLSVAFLAALLAMAASAKEVAERQNRELFAANEELRESKKVLERTNDERVAAYKALQTSKTELEEKNVQLKDSVALAKEQNQLALETHKYFITEVHDALKKVPGSGEARRVMLSGVQKLAKKVSDQYASREEIDRNSFLILVELGDLLLAIGAPKPAEAPEGMDPIGEKSGALTQARELFDQAHALAEQRAAANPADVQAQDDLWVSKSRLGDVMQRLGETAEARKYFEESLTIARDQAAARPDYLPALRNLSLTYNNLGEITRQMGEWTTAREHYKEFLHIAEQLAEAAPDDFQARRDLWGGNQRLGSVASHLGDHAAARDYFEKSMKIAEPLALVAPRTALDLNYMAVTHIRLGEVAAQQENLDAASRHFEDARRIASEVLLIEPNDIQFRRRLGLSYSKLGEMASLRKQHAEAQAHYQESLAISQKLADEDPDDALSQRELAAREHQFGLVLFRQKDLADARKHYEKSLAILENLVARDGNDAQSLRELLRVNNTLGDLHWKSKDAAAARQNYERSVSIAQGLAEQDPNIRAQRDWWMSLNGLGDIALGDRDFGPARSYHMQALMLAERVAEAHPHNKGVRLEVAVSHGRLGDVASVERDFTTARTCYRRQLAIVESLSAADAKNVRYHRDWTICQLRLGEVEQALQQYEAAIAELEQGERIVVQFNERTGGNDFGKELSDLRLRLQQCRQAVERKRPPATTE